MAVKDTDKLIKMNGWATSKLKTLLITSNLKLLDVLTKIIQIAVFCILSTLT